MISIINIAVVNKNLLKTSTAINLISLSFLNRIKFYSSHQKISQSQWKLSDRQQKTIISLQTINYILSIDEEQLLKEKRSIRQRIFSREHLRRLLKKPQQPQLTLGKQLKKQGEFTNLNEAGFSQNNIMSVLQAFDLKRGVKYNQIIYSTNKFKVAARSDLLVFSPTFITAKIIKTIIQSQNRKFICGQGGIGKSFAYLIYDFLSSFIIDYRIKLQMDNIIPSKRFTHLVTSQQLKSFKKLFYIPISKLYQPQSIVLLFKFQSFQLQNEENKPVYSMSKKINSQLSNYLSSIKQFYDRINIQTVCIFDGFSGYHNIYYQTSNKNRTIPQPKYINMLDSLVDRFNLCIFNSYEQIDENIVEYWNKVNYPQKYPNIFYGLDKQNKGDIINLKFYQILKTKKGHLYFYQQMWQELCNKNYDVAKPQMKKIKDIFDRTFGIIRNDLKKNDKFIFWKYHIPLHNFCICYFYLSRFQKALQQKKEKLIIKTLKNLKNQIEDYGYKRQLKKYEQQNIKRPHKIECPFIYNYIYRYKINLDYIYKCQIFLLLYIKATNQLRYQHTNFKVQIQAQPLLQGRKKYRNYNTIEEQLFYYSQYPKIGFNFPKNDIKVNFNNSTYYQLNNLFTNLYSITRWSKKLMKNSKLRYQDGNRYFKLIYSRVFNLQLSQLSVSYIYIINIHSNTYAQNQQRYGIKKLIPIQGIRNISQLQLQNSLRQMITTAIESPQQFYIGYPMQLKIKLINYKKENIQDITQQEKDIVESVNKYTHHFPQNALFDYLLMRKRGNRIEIRTFYHKIDYLQRVILQTNTKEIERQLLRISYQYKLMIDWQHTIFAPDKQIKQWLETISQRKQRGQVQEWYLNGSIKQIKSLTFEQGIAGTIKLNISNLQLNKTTQIFKIFENNSLIKIQPPPVLRQISEHIYSNIHLYRPR